MPTTSVAVLDALSSLIEAERNSVCRLMGEGSPYLKQANEQVRSRFREMAESSYRYEAELADVIRRMGGQPTPPLGIEPDAQFLGLLSLKFLLPKVVHTKELMIERYHNALRALRDGPPEVVAVLRRHLAQHESDLALAREAIKPQSAASPAGQAR